jgi:hypothetical protein
MSSRTFYFIVIVIVIGIVGTSMLGVKLLNHTQETDNLPEGGRIDWGEKAKEIALKDDKVQELVGGKPVSVPTGVIWEGTYAELFFRIGGSNTSKEGHLIGGKIYKIGIDLNNGTVKFIEEEKNQTIINWIENVTVEPH